MTLRHYKLLVGILMLSFGISYAQTSIDPKLLTLERIYNSSEFRQERLQPIQWIQDGEAYVTVDYSRTGNQLKLWDTASGETSTFIPENKLMAGGQPILVESFTLSKDESKVLIFVYS